MTQHDEVLKETDDRIAWILAHPGMSAWLKTTLKTALECDAIAVVNDLEILNMLLRARCDAIMDSAFDDPNLERDAGTALRD